MPDRCAVAGGVERLCTALLPELAALGHEVVWAVPSHRMPALAAALGDARVRLVAVEWPRHTWQRWMAAAARRARGVLPVSRVADALHRLRIEDLRARHGSGHELYPWVLGEPVPRPTSTPRTIFVLDRNWSRFPGNFAERAEVLDDRVERWMRVAAHVVTLSDTVAADLAARWPDLAHKLAVVPLAARAATAPECGAVNATAGAPSFFYPATWAPHKGHDTLVAAVARLVARDTLVHVDLTGYGTDAIAGATAGDGRCVFEAVSGRPAPITGHGYVAPETVEAMYRAAWAVVLPSRYEGFGLPLAEAIAHGTPVICSDLPTYREQAARLDVAYAVTFVPPGDVAALADAMAAAVARGPVSDREREAIGAHARRWAWCDVARACTRLWSEAAA